VPLLAGYCEFSSDDITMPPTNAKVAAETFEY
jgi:hypothetical protein